MADDLHELGRMLVRVRQQKGMTQQALAVLVGIHVNQIQRYERYEYAPASLERLAAIGCALGVSVRF